MDRTEAMICQHFYWPEIRHAVWRKESNCETCQYTRISNKKYGKLQDKLAEEIPQNKICVDIIGLYVIRKKVKKVNLHLEAVTMTNPVI